MCKAQGSTTAPVKLERVGSQGCSHCQGPLHNLGPHGCWRGQPLGIWPRSVDLYEAEQDKAQSRCFLSEIKVVLSGSYEHPDEDAGDAITTSNWGPTARQRNDMLDISHLANLANLTLDSTNSTLCRLLHCTEASELSVVDPRSRPRNLPEIAPLAWRDCWPMTPIVQRSRLLDMDSLGAADRRRNGQDTTTSHDVGLEMSDGSLSSGQASKRPGFSQSSRQWVRGSQGAKDGQK